MLIPGFLYCGVCPHELRCGKPAKRNQTVSLSPRLTMARYRCWSSLHSELSRLQTFLSVVYLDLISEDFYFIADYLKDG